MQQVQKIILTVLLVVAVFSGTAAQAQAATTDLPTGVLIGDQDGLTVPVTGEYFIDADGLEAGDVITKKLVIRNTESYPYKIAMLAQPVAETGPLRLLDEVRCTLALDGTVLYNGRARGDEGFNMIASGLDLGTYESGEQKTLDITLTVSPGMKKYYWTASESIFKWCFYATRDENSKPPKTGEIVKTSLYFIFPGMVITMGILLLVKRREQAKAL